MSTFTHFQIIVAALAALATIFSLMGLGFRYVYKQGAANAEHLIATRANTKATEELGVAFHEFAMGNTATIADHEHRLTIIETMNKERSR
jgi:hypothetical protein